MQPLEAFTLKAFLAALLQLDSPLPSDLQAQVNQIRIPADVGNLHTLAKKYLPLAEFYQAARQTLNSISEERGKGFLPVNEPEPSSTEIDNVVRQSSFRKMVVKVDKEIDDETLAETVPKILSSPDSVRAAATIFKYLQP